MHRAEPGQGRHGEIPTGLAVEFPRFIGLDQSPAWLSSDWLVSAFGDHRAEAIVHYLQFVADSMHRDSVWSDLTLQIYLGDDQFIERIQSLIDTNRGLSEIPAAQSRPVPKPLSEYPGQEIDRDRAIARAYQVEDTHSGR
jgi:putative transposase